MSSHVPGLFRFKETKRPKDEDAVPRRKSCVGSVHVTRPLSMVKLEFEFDERLEVLEKVLLR